MPASVLEIMKAKPQSDGPSSYIARRTAWWEKSSLDGEKWLRSAASSGDCFAMERLAERLRSGAGLPASKEDAFSWLRRAVEMGSISAHYTLGAWILDGEPCGSYEEAGSLLNRAADAGFAPAMLELGLQLLSGDKLPLAPALGQNWLVAAAESGDRLSMIFLGRYVSKGSALSLSAAEGHKWLRRAGLSNEKGLSKLGYFIMKTGPSAPTASIRQRLMDEAASLFFESWQQENSVSTGATLGYLIRRREVQCKLFPTLGELFKDGLEEEYPVVQVNEALRKAQGVQCAVDWERADSLMSSLDDTSEVREWWQPLAKQGDPEGHLVLAWLVRHALATDPDGLELVSRLQLIDNSWDVPEWMGSRK